jgi:replication-associated recombination protein RarA
MTGTITSENYALINDIMNKPEMCPCLLIGKLVLDFRKMYKGHIIHLDNVGEVRSLIENFYGYSELGRGTHLVIDNVGFLSSQGQTGLLKFIEDAQYPVICLSYIDNIFPTILSRMKYVYKQSLTSVKKMEFLRPSDMFQLLEREKSKNKDFNRYDEMKLYADKSPIGFVLKHSTRDIGSIPERVAMLISGHDRRDSSGDDMGGHE